MENQAHFRLLNLFLVGFIILLGLALLNQNVAASDQVVRNPAGTDTVPTTITYQGYLEDSGAPFSGTANLQFALYNAASGGSQVGATQTADGVSISDGLFTVILDFGASAFDGNSRYLQITVNGTTLSPRSPIGSTPYALKAGTVDYANITGLPAANAHTHLGQTWTASNNGLTINGSSSSRSILVLSNSSTSSTGSVIDIDSSGYDGIKMGSISNDGMFLNGIGDDGIHMETVGGDGVFVNNAERGFKATNTKYFGFYVEKVTNADFLSSNFLTGDGFRVDDAADDGFHVTVAGDDGIDIENVGNDGVLVRNAGDDGVSIENAGQDGILVQQAGTTQSDGDGFAVEQASGYGVYVINSGGGMKAAARFNGDIILNGGRICYGVAADGSGTSCSTPSLRSGPNQVPEIADIQTGNIVLDANGEATVDLPEGYDLAFTDFRYNLTPIGGFAPIYIAEEVDAGSFKIAGGEAGLKISWQVHGTPAADQDVDAQK